MRPEDKPKIILLAVGIGFCLIFIFINLLKGSGKTEPPVVVKVNPAATSTVPPAGTTGLGTSIYLSMDPSSPRTNRNPFLAFPKTSDDDGNMLGAPKATKPDGTKPTSGQRSSNQKAPPFGSGQVKPFVPDAISVQPLVLPKVTLKGVMAGNSGVAVFSVGTDTVTVNVGQSAFSKVSTESTFRKFKLVRVTDSTAVVSDGKTSVSFSIGETKDIIVMQTPPPGLRSGVTAPPGGILHINPDQTLPKVGG